MMEESGKPPKIIWHPYAPWAGVLSVRQNELPEYSDGDCDWIYDIN